MQQIALYLSIMTACYLFSSILVKNKEKFAFVSNATGIAIYLLIFVMGLRIGANEEAMGNLSAIGGQALITIIMALAGSILFAFIIRKIFGLNRYGLREGNDNIKINEKELVSDSGLKSSMITLGDAIFGIVGGYFLIPVLFKDIDLFQSVAGRSIDVLLCILLGSVGFDLGLEGNIIIKFRSIGIRIVLMPLSVIAGTFAAGAIYGLFSPYSMRESVAIFGGMGWYSFSPVVIMEAGYISASAVSFLHNILREVLSLMFIPLIADKIGYFEAVSMPGSPGMDCCLPSVKRSTNGEMVLYSLFSGLIISILIPVWMPLIIGG